MNINNLPTPGTFSGAVRLNKEVAQAITSVEIHYNWGSTKEAEKLRAYFKHCIDFLDKTIIEDSKSKKKSKQTKDE